MIPLIYLILTAICHAHEGHIDHGQIHNGEISGRDNIHYFDVGSSVAWGDKKLLRRLTGDNQVIYQFEGGVDENWNSTALNNELALKVPGGEKLKGFSFNHAGEKPIQLKVISPNMESLTEISKSNNFVVLWENSQPKTIIRIILEIYSSTGELIGRLTVSTNDDGEFVLSSHLLQQLPSGKGQLAIKRISTGGFYIDKDHSELAGVRIASSVVGNIHVVK